MIIFFFALSIFIIYKAPFFHLRTTTRFELSLLYSLKVLAGVAVYFLYTYHYTERSDADIYKYFDDALILNKLAYSDFWIYLEFFFGVENYDTASVLCREEMLYWDRPHNYGLLNDNRTIVRLHSIMGFLSLGNYQVHNILFNLLSFSGLIALWKFFEYRFKVKKWTLILSLFVFPTICIWSSTVLKESILIFALGFFVYSIFVKNRVVNYLVASILFILLAGIKPYVLFALLPSFLFLGLIRFLSGSRVIIAFVSITVFALSIYFVNEYSSVKILDNLILKQQDFIALAKNSNANSVYAIPQLTNSFDILKYGVTAVATCLFRPFIWEANGLFSVLAAVENVFLLVLIFFFLLNCRLKAWNEWCWFSLLFILTLALVVGLTTPVFGALVRYKMPLIPFFLILIFHLGDYQKIYNKFPALKKLEKL